MAAEARKDLIADAKNFCDSLANVFMMKKRDPQTKHLLEKAQLLLESLITESQKPTPPPRPPIKPRTSGSMGQLWVKLDEMKRENDTLKRQIERSVSHDEKSVTTKHQGPGEVIIADLHRTKGENELMAAQVDHLKKELKSLQNINSSVQDEYKSMRIAMETKQADLERVKKEYKALESRLNSAKTENDTLKQRLTKSVKPMVREVDYRQVENISDKCRPSTIAMKYNNIESQEWVDAKETLDDLGQFEEEEITKFLCSALSQSYACAQLLHRQLEASVTQLLNNPTLALQFPSTNGISNEASSKHLPEDISSNIHNFLKSNCEDINVECLKQMVQQNLEQEFHNIFQNDAIHLKPIDRYFTECCRISWQMVVQLPPMFLGLTDMTFDDEKHKLWWSCDKNSAVNIDFFVWPVLYDYENGNVLVKGCVHTQ